MLGNLMADMTGGKLCREISIFSSIGTKNPSLLACASIAQIPQNPLSKLSSSQLPHRLMQLFRQDASRPIEIDKGIADCFSRSLNQKKCAFQKQNA